MRWDDFRSLVDANHRFLISSHMSLDGDSVGSQVAMRWYLTSLGKDVTIYNKDPVPAKFAFLTVHDTILNDKPDSAFDVLIVLDCSNCSRLGWKVEAIAPVMVNIDHHRDNTGFGAVNIVDSNAAATGAILYRFFCDCSIDFPPYVAEALYTAIMTDTGGFRFSNTTGAILRYCSELVEHGADCSSIYEKVYASHAPKALLLQARIWSTLRFHLDGKVCCMDMPLAVLDELEAHYSDSEGMADNTIIAEGVEVGMLIKYDEKESHFSLRSKGKVDVGKIAQKIPGGGGHFSAAGCTISRPYGEAFSFMIDILRRELG
ncbi:MAG: DHH family phosphoesterase [Chitinispirillaceae bacterium]|nr:DHH family phosphoesterase [Chitinispirillaceae bacterium]